MATGPWVTENPDTTKTPEALARGGLFCCSLWAGDLRIPLRRVGFLMLKRHQQGLNTHPYYAGWCIFELSPGFEPRTPYGDDQRRSLGYKRSSATQLEGRRC